MKARSVVPGAWRDVLARAPLPMLALAASYGVYSFALLFVPAWVAVVQAAAFELVYIGLAVVKLSPDQQRRARAISIGAVVVSMMYNSLDGLFRRRPDLLDQPPLWLDLGLSVLHGVPLALLAYLVADLLLHTSAASSSALLTETSAQNGNGSHKMDMPSEPIRGGRPVGFTLDDLADLGDLPFSRDQVVDRLRCSEATATRLLSDGVAAGRLVREGRGVYKLV